MVLIIGIAGGSGAGKTTIARRIAEALPEGSAHLLEHDNYYKDHAELSDEQRARVNYDHPDALDSMLLVEHLIHLREGNSCQVPHYDFATHRRRTETTRLEPRPVVIVEGILVLADPRLREQFDLKLFVDTDPDIRVLRRVRRDLLERGRTFESIRAQYYETVRPMHAEFVEPSRRCADLIIPEGGENKAALEVIIARLLQATVA